MNVSAMTLLGAREFAAAREPCDLVPGNVRTIAAFEDGLRTGAAWLAQTSPDLGRATTALAQSWSGSAADAFATHLHAVQTCIDRWNEAADLVLEALGTHRTDLTASQDRVADALRLWDAVRRQLAAQGRWHNETADLAGNATAVRAQIDANIHATAQRAHALLHQARTALAQTGGTAADVVSQAVELLRGTPIPDLADDPLADAGVNATTPTTAVPPVAASMADGSTTTSHGGLLPGWIGPTVTVRPPSDGVHDTLWRIAARTLGDPRRWPEIYRLNAGQPVGAGVLSDPNVVRPGWVLRLPEPTPITGHIDTGREHSDSQQSTHPGHPHAPGSDTTTGPTPTRPIPGPAHTQPAPTTQHNGPHATAPPTSAPTTSHPPAAGQPVASTADHGTDHAGRSVDLGGGLVLAGAVVAGLAATGLTASALAARRHRRASAADPPVAAGPIVRELGDGVLHRDPASHTTTSSPHLDTGGQPTAASHSDGTPFGHRAGHSVLIDVAATVGLGLAGPGALGAARALLISTLATQPRCRALLTEHDRRRLLDPAAPAASPPPTGPRPAPSWQPPQQRVQVTTSLSELLDDVEAEIVSRTRALEDSHGRATPPPLLIIVTVPDNTRRLQAAADLGAGLGITLIVLGGWPAGLTCVVDATGRITDTAGAQADQWPVRGLHAYTADAQDTSDLVRLLTTPTPTRGAAPAPSGDASGDQNGRPDVSQPGAESVPDDPARDPQITPASGQIARRLTGNPAAAQEIAPSHSERPSPAAATDTAMTTAQGAVEETTTSAVTVRVFGGVRLFHSARPRLGERTHASAGDSAETATEITSAIGPRLRELVAFMALHPDGVRRDEVVEAVWPNTNPRRHTHALNSALARLRHAVDRATNGTVAELIAHTDDRLRIDHEQVDIDVWRFQDAWKAARATTEPTAREAAYRRMVAAYTGSFADGIDADWVAAPRQSLHRAATDAVSGLARLLVDIDPSQTLDLLDSARAWDPYNEHLYRDITRLQAHLGQTDAIPRTLELLTVRLAEITTAVSAETRALAAGLQRRTGHSAPHADVPTDPG